MLGETLCSLQMCLAQIKSTYSLHQHSCAHLGSLEGVTMSNSWGDSKRPVGLWLQWKTVVWKGSSSIPSTLIMYSSFPRTAFCTCSFSGWARLWFGLQPNGSSTYQGYGRFQSKIFHHLVRIKNSVSPVLWWALLPWVRRWRREWNFWWGWRWAGERSLSTLQWSGRSVRSILLVSDSTRKAFSTFLAPFCFPFSPSIPLGC